MNEDDQAPAAAPAPRASFGSTALLPHILRVLAFRALPSQALKVSPAMVASLVLDGHLILLAIQWALAPEPAFFLWNGFFAVWVGIGITAWLCWVAARSSGTVTAATLFTLVCGAWVMLGVLTGIGGVALALAFGPVDEWPAAARNVAELLPLCWAGAAQLVLLVRVAVSAPSRATVLLLAPLPVVLCAWLAPVQVWWSMPDKADPEPEYGLKLTEEVLATQPRLLAKALTALAPPNDGRVNVYAITYAPYAMEDVFMRESAVVSKTMRERFGAEGRTVELVANPATTLKLPWATPLNLRQTIARMAATMDRERDVLFLHLTSHGGADGRLAADTAPLQTEPMTPELLKRWLDEAGVRWRVISVSACYSGSWIGPLAGDGTLVMTAADADHTSYGCGRRSELTFFGRAMYEEALRKTWSFTEAHAWARKVIDVREQEAGKSDGYSNPQISEGAGIRPVLERLADQQRVR
ncbi:MAG: hypothetical protein EON58_01775 [Alphaproteobacteria bacterium]|nr:MAG: hypothetical protein EON58_01775 [Alphaproteobacteria bacterium]